RRFRARHGRQLRTDWFIYALGGGWGHLTRAAALARRAPAGCEVAIVTNSPYADVVRASLPELRIVTGDPVELVREAKPEWFIVDTFPRGLGGELAPVLGEVPCRKALNHRDLNPEYVRRYNVVEFVREHYDRVFAVDAAPPQFSAMRTAPWLIR